jgi:hypothetical protein
MRKPRLTSKSVIHLHTLETTFPCLHMAHNQASPGGILLRYADTKACLQCVEALRRPRIQLDINLITPRQRSRFLDFWSHVGIGSPDECWAWNGTMNGKRPYYAFRRDFNGFGRAGWAPPRIAFWFTWGDIGTLLIRHTCPDTTCCNPLHLRAVGVPHSPWAHCLDRIDLRACDRKITATAIRSRDLKRDIEKEKLPMALSDAPLSSHDRLLRAIHGDDPV